MEDTSDDFSRLSLKEITGNRVELLNRIQQQLQNAVDSLNAGSDFSPKERVGRILQQVIKNLDFIKASCNEEGKGNCFLQSETETNSFSIILINFPKSFLIDCVHFPFF